MAEIAERNIYTSPYKREYERKNINIKARTTKNEIHQSEMSAKAKGRIMSILIIAGILIVGIVLFAAYNSSVAFKNEEMTKENKALKGEVEYLRIQLEGANNVSAVEEVATNSFGMVYPGDDQYVVLKNKKEADKSAKAN